MKNNIQKQTLELLAGKRCADIFVNVAQCYATTCEYHQHLLQTQTPDISNHKLCRQKICCTVSCDMVWYDEWFAL